MNNESTALRYTLTLTLALHRSMKRLLCDNSSRFVQLRHKIQNTYKYFTVVTPLHSSTSQLDIRIRQPRLKPPGSVKIRNQNGYETRGRSRAFPPGSERLSG